MLQYGKMSFSVKLRLIKIDMPLNENVCGDEKFFFMILEDKKTEKETQMIPIRNSFGRC